MFEKLKSLALKLTGVEASTRRSRQEEFFRSARVDRHSEDFQPSHRGGSTAVKQSWDMMTRRLREQVENDGFTRRAANATTTLVVGTGISSFADAVNLDALVEDAANIESLLRFEPWNAESDHYYDRWCQDGADVHQVSLHHPQRSWQDMMRAGFREMPSTGNAIFLRCQRKRPNQPATLCWDLIEWEQLDRTKDRAGGEAKAEQKIVNGLQYNSRGDFVGAWIYDAHPYESYFGAGYGAKSTFVPADRIYHVFVPFRPSARCGASWFNALMQPARDLDNYLGNELTSAALGALLVAAIKRKDPRGGKGIGIATDKHRNAVDTPELKLGKGIVAEIFTDEDVQMLQSNRPPGSSVPWLDLILHQLAASADISYYRLTGNYKNTSYSSARAAQLDDEIFNHPLQNFYARSIVRPARLMHDQQLAGRGVYRTLSARDYVANQHMLDQYFMIGPGRPLLDPEKERDADAAGLRIGVTTLKEVCGRASKNWRRVIDQRAIEEAYAEQRGVQLDFSGQQGGNPRDSNTAEQQDAADRADNEESSDGEESVNPLLSRMNGNGIR